MELIIGYLKENAIMSAVAAYFIFGGVLKILDVADILPRCLSVLLLGRECYGCGITTAMLHILKFEFAAAYHTNALAFVLMPAGIYYIVANFMAYRARVAMD